MMDGNMTLAEARQAMLESEAMDPVLGMIKIYRSVRVRFVSLPDEVELPDDMLLSEFRDLCSRNEAKLVVDDKGGGLSVRAPEPELA